MASLHQNNINENQENDNGKVSLKQVGLQQRTALSSISSNRVQGLTRSKSLVSNENVNTKQTFKFFKSKAEQSRETRPVLGLRENTSKQSFTVFCDEPVEKPKQKQTFSVYCDTETSVAKVELKPKEIPTVSEKPVLTTESVPEPEPVVKDEPCEAPSGNAQSESDRLSEKGSVSPSESDKENRYKQPLAYTEESSVIRESIFGTRTVFTIGGESSTSELPSIGEDEVLASPAVAENVAPVARVVEDDSQFSEEYTVDIYKYLRSIEERLRPRYNYMRKQPDITPAMRSILVDWLVEVSDEYKLHDETLHLAVSYIDRFLSHMSVLRGKLQLVGTAAMFIAAKYEEIYPPEVSEFVYITDDTYTKKQVLRMEHLILKVLAFDLAAPTPLYFLHRFSRLEPTTDEVKHLAMYLCQLSLLECDPYLQFLPSKIAASAFAIARHTFLREPWSENLTEKTGYSLGDLRDVSYYLHKTFVAAPLHPQKALVEKFGTSKYSFVSQTRPRPLFHFPI